MQQIDHELLLAAKRGEEAAIAALIARMMPAVRKGAAANMAPGLDFEDAVQEGLIGLFHAVRSYEESYGAPFAPYAAACIVHAQQDARRGATRKKHTPLNDSVPLPEELTSAGPEDLAAANEAYADTLDRMGRLLSAFERQALLQSLNGHSAQDTALALGTTRKAVENALARARKKLRGAP